MRKVLLSIAVMAAVGAAAPAAQTNSCDIRAWGADPHTQIRAAPSSSARLLGTFRHRPGEESSAGADAIFPEFRIDAARGGWFHVVSTDYGDYGDEPPRWRYYRGAGWVHGRQLGGQVLSGRLYTAPSLRSRSRAFGKEADIVQIRQILDCKGRWVKLDADIGTGWVSGICNNQVTTCS